ncbi:hypothetical protein L7F22_011599 [Adiantum nelumboides]|nr:hypothetical protein [Adiantum nelumboides]
MGKLGAIWKPTDVIVPVRMSKEKITDPSLSPTTALIYGMWLTTMARTCTSSYTPLCGVITTTLRILNQKARGLLVVIHCSTSDNPFCENITLGYQSTTLQHSEPCKARIAMAKEETKDYSDPPPAPFIDGSEFGLWSFYRACIAEFVATLLFLYITVATVIGASQAASCGGVGLLGISWAFGGMIFILVYCTAGISGGHINPAVTFGLFLARKVTLLRTVAYIVAQCLGAICGVALIKSFQSSLYVQSGGGANMVASPYSKKTGLAAEIIGTFVLVYTVFSATDPKRNARDSHVPVLAPLPIGFAVFMVHLATIPITGTGINPARSFGAAVIYGHKKSWDDHWIFWVGPFIGAALAASYHQIVLRAGAFKAFGSSRSQTNF